MSLVAVGDGYNPAIIIVCASKQPAQSV
jgi:hypothetical protein